MVGRMPKRSRVDQLATEFGVADNGLTPETPQQRQQRIAQAIQHTQSLVGDIQNGARANRASRDDMVMRKAHRLAKSYLNEGLSLNDLAAGLDRMPNLAMSDVMLPDVPLPAHGNQMLTEEFPTNHDDVIMNELYNPPQSIAHQQGRKRGQFAPVPTVEKQRLFEQPTRRAEPQTVTENWKVKRYLGETRGGSEVHVWRVENAKTGTKLPSLFRIEGVASRIVLALNESGDLNDPRVLSLTNAYEKRDRLLKEARQLEKSADGKQMKSERLRQIRAEINQLDYKLGV